MTATIRPLRSLADSRAWPLPLPDAEKQARSAFADGKDAGERMGYVRGWRVGLAYGLLYGVPMGMACMYGLIHLGQLLGG